MYDDLYVVGDGCFEFVGCVCWIVLVVVFDELYWFVVLVVGCVYFVDGIVYVGVEGLFSGGLWV